MVLKVYFKKLNYICLQFKVTKIQIMPTEIERLSEEDQLILLKSPAIVALLAAISDDGVVSKLERAKSIKLAPVRTYSSPEILRNFYTMAESHIVDALESELPKLPQGQEEKEAYLENKLTELNQVLPKLNQVYAKELVASLKSFAKHIFESDSSVLEYFILPIFMNKIEKESFNPKIGE